MRCLAVVLLFFFCLLTPIRISESAPATVNPDQRHQGSRRDSRDERGIPYVEAQNDEDLYFGQGYATAADRLWQMDLFRRTARGELAEILGGKSRTGAGQTTSHLWLFAGRRSGVCRCLAKSARDSGSLRPRRERLCRHRSTRNRCRPSFKFCSTAFVRGLQPIPLS